MQSRPPDRSEEWMDQGLGEYLFFQHLFNLRFLLVIASALLFLTIFWQTTEDLEGEVYDHETRAILPDAKVFLNDFRGVALDSAVTDTAGHFNFVVRQRQIYTLHISKPGYMPRMVSDTEKMSITRSVVIRIGVHRMPPPPLTPFPAE